MQLKNELWFFALNFYQQPDVEKNCLELQDRYGLSINRLIFACWCGVNGISAKTSHFIGGAGEWQSEVTHRVRKARYYLRPDKEKYAECYQQLRKAELACEQVELALLHEQVEDMVRKELQSMVLVEKNLERYLKSENLPIDRDIGTALLPLKDAVLKNYLSE